jgi:multiple antibiotic resistance protein
LLGARAYRAHPGPIGGNGIVSEPVYLFLSDTLHAWLVLFAMVNAVGNLPVFADLTDGLTTVERARVFRVATAVGAGIVLGFALPGHWMLASVFQVDTGAFKIAGGILVFIVAARGMMWGPRLLIPTPKDPLDNIAFFPIGFPFLAGPGTIVTTILLMQTWGHLVTVCAAIAVYLVILPLLHLAPLIQRAVGRMGALVIARILYIFIAAKAVTFILAGLRAVAEAGP